MVRQTTTATGGLDQETTAPVGGLALSRLVAVAAMVSTHTAGGVMVAGNSQRYSQTWVSGSTLPLASNLAHGRGPGEAETPFGKSAGLGLALLL